MIKEIDVMRHINSYGKEMNKLNRELTNGDMIRALTNLSFSWVLEDKSLISQQIAILQSSQGLSYKPFISGELNKAIKLGMDANTNMMGLLKAMTSSNGPITPYQDPDNGPTEKGITADDAVRLFKAHDYPALNRDEAQRDRLALEYDIENMPEVNALLQVNMDTSKEGLNMMNITKLDESLIINHGNRREEEFDIDIDSDQV